MATSPSSTTSASSFFTGNSAYSSDFQNAITRAVQIASLPITQLNSDKTALTAQATEIGTLDAKFTGLQTAVNNIDTAVSGSSFDATVSDPNALSATLSDGATEGNYTVQISDIGAYATSLSSATWVDTPGAAQTYKLVIGGTSYNIAPTDNSATSVAAAINSREGDKVQATVVNVGSNSAPDYRIALQNQALGASPVDLQLNGTSLQTQQAQGRLAQYEVNGSGLTVSSDSRTATIANGVTVDLLSSSDASPVNITVTRSTTNLANALSGFATAYNAAVDEVNAQRGQNAGPLQGQAIVFDLSQALGSIGTYSDGSSFGGLSSLGLTLGSDGHLTFDEPTLLGADFSNSAAVTSFLGSVANGGFLQNVNNTLTGIEDPTNGSIKTTESAFETEISQITDQANSRQQQVDLLQTQLTNEMASSDALISTMQQQYTYLSGMFQAEQTADLQYARG